jgi:uncharacterized membrane protein
MKNLNQLLTKPLKEINKKSIIAIFLLALIGFADAAYLTVEHFANKIPPCSIGGCETVLTSQYANIIGIPVSLVGAIFYLIILVSLVLYIDTKKPIFFRLPAILTIVGAIVSIILVSLMIFVIHSICLYCMVSDTITVVIALISIIILRKNKNEVTV